MVEAAKLTRYEERYHEAGAALTRYEEVVMGLRQTIAQLRKGAEQIEGITLDCLRCGKRVLLPYTDAAEDRVAIKPIEGWTAPPLRCPDCSEAQECEYQRSGG
jgi:DNA-directed RNA polymerase subunit RPC12/RpoP